MRPGQARAFCFFGPIRQMKAREVTMEFTRKNAEIYVPDGAAPGDALARTTHLGIGAHQDDLEIMCLEGILAGFGRQDTWFTGVVVTDGSGSARDSLYANYS